MKFDIIPFKGTDALKLGQTSRENQTTLKRVPTVFSKYSNEPDVEDYEICHIYYDTKGRSVAIEYFEPAEVFFRGISLLGEKPRKIKRKFKEWDPDIIEDCDGFVSLKYSIGITFCEGSVAGVMVAQKDYLNFWADDSCDSDSIVPAIKSFHWIPQIGIKELPLGLTPEQNHEILKVQPVLRPELVLDSETEENTYYPEDYGVCYIYYDNKGKSCFIEFRHTAVLLYEEINLMSAKSLDIYKRLKQIDEDIHCNDPTDERFISSKYCIEITPNLGEIILVGVARKDYFNNII